VSKPKTPQHFPPPAAPKPHAHGPAAAELALRTVRDELEPLSRDLESAALYLPAGDGHVGELKDLAASLRLLRTACARLAIQLEEARHAGELLAGLERELSAARDCLPSSPPSPEEMAEDPQALVDALSGARESLETAHQLLRDLKGARHD
jgi:hypothetical protein